MTNYLEYKNKRLIKALRAKKNRENRNKRLYLINEKMIISNYFFYQEYKLFAILYTKKK